MRDSMKRYLAVAVVLATAGLAAACSGGGNDLGAGGSATAGKATGDVASREAAGAAPGPAGVPRTTVHVRAKIRTGEIWLTTQHPGEARAAVDRLLSELGGHVDDEESTHARDGSLERSTLVLRVPVDRFASAMDTLERIGRMRTSASRSRDVTSQVIDVEERVRTLRTSIDRLHTFQRDTANIDDLIRFEREITDREAELQSLVTQRDYLADQTTMSTITLHLSTPEKYVAPPDALRDAGFLAGLKAGWHALADTVVVALTVIGAVLPFALVLALLGLPLSLLVRRQLRARRTATASPSE
jgi:hypothetical protein